MTTKDLTGQTFGRLLVLERAGSKNGRAAWLCECICGNKTVVSGEVLRRGTSKSCGCLKKEVAAKRASDRAPSLAKANTKHGMCKTRLYGIWGNLKARCKNKTNNDYGGRGITVCPEWQESFEAFRDWALANGYRDDLTIERKDVNGNYCPENCCWKTKKEQSNNKRNNIKIEYKGKSQTMAQWAAEIGITHMTLWKRLKRGWPIERALSPTKNRRN